VGLELYWNVNRITGAIIAEREARQLIVVQGSQISASVHLFVILIGCVYCCVRSLVGCQMNLTGMLESLTPTPLHSAQKLKVFIMCTGITFTEFLLLEFHLLEFCLLGMLIYCCVWTQAMAPKTPRSVL